VRTDATWDGFLAEACVNLKFVVSEANLAYRQFYGVFQHYEGHNDRSGCYGPLLTLTGADDWQNILGKMRAAGKDGRVVEMEIVNVTLKVSP
jgi:hypothetical protein